MSFELSQGEFSINDIKEATAMPTMQATVGSFCKLRVKVQKSQG